MNGTRTHAASPETHAEIEGVKGSPAMTSSLRPTRLPPAVAQLLHEFHGVYGLDASVWMRTEGGWELAVATSPAAGGVLPEQALPISAGELDLALHVSGGEVGRSHARFLAQVVARVLRQEEESRFFGREIGERYEEITLLYSISEILGSVISLEQAASTILEEVAGTLVVNRAALWLYDPESRRLDLIAAVGAAGQKGPIDIQDPYSITAEAFRDRRPINLEPGEEFPRDSPPPELRSRDSLLSVPVSYTPPEGDVRTIGVINLIGRGGERFSAGDQKLMMAIASQIGAAVENSRLVEASLQQERMVREMELAHDLQLKLLPSPLVIAARCDVAARCRSAESVGGDLYNFINLREGRIGAMIGDVSSHGFSAALIMALTMSAVAIHASEGDSPSEVLQRTHRTLIDELENTEMYMTLFYCVIDPALGQLTYANAGHAHAFQVFADGKSQRLSATNPPLGVVDLDAYGEQMIPWTSGADLLCLFTDGLSDALDLGEIQGQRTILAEVVRSRDEGVGEILRRLYDLQRVESAIPADDRTAVLVRF